MKLLFNHIQNARDSLRANQMRTFLTITGVAIGVASIVAILSLATGASSIITKQVDDTGGNIAVIRPGASQTTSIKDIVNHQAYNATGASTLTASDVARVQMIPSVQSVAPIMVAHVTLTGDNAYESALVGTTEDLLKISNIPIREGEFAPDDQKLVTIGAQLSINLFGTEESLGKTVKIKGQQYRVGGIIERQQNPMNFNGVDIDNAAIISPTQLRILQPTAQVQQINVQTDSVTHLDRVVIDINKALIDQHGGETDFRVLVGDEIAAPTGQLFFIIAGVTTAIAAISLFVGGIGIMNIMLVNVAERTHEIGIRKALGATHSDIVWQFLIESLIMALVGGVMGGILGLALAFCISLFLTFDPVITWETAAVTAGISTLVGVVFGLYPAIRAARKNPIESLNQHN